MRYDRSMQDFAVEQDNYGLFDVVVDLEHRDFKSVEGMETAFNVQLFTDQRVTKNEISRPLDKKGWVGDMLTREEGYQIGSLLHIKEMGRDTQLEKNEVAEYAKDALNYFVSIGASKEVSARVIGSNIEGEIVNESNETNRYSKLWRATNAIKS